MSIAERINATQSREESTENGRSSALVLIVDTSWKNREAFEERLTKDGLSVISADNWLQAEQIVDNFNPQIMVIDSRGAGVSAKELAKYRVPYIVTSRLNAEEDESKERVSTLDAGADYFLTKPIEPALLSAHVRAALRPVDNIKWRDEIIKFQGVELQRGTIIRKGSEAVILTNQESKVLKELVSNQGKVLTNQELLANTWGSEYVNDEQYLRVWISRIREKLEGIGAFDVIKTLPGIGYQVESHETRLTEKDDYAPEVIIVPGVKPEHQPEEKKRVLAVDDNASNLSLLRYDLSSSSYSLRTATDRHEAEDIMESFVPDFILAGQNFVVVPSKEGYTVPWLAMVEKNIDGISMLDAGASNFEVSPVNVELVEAKMKTILRRHEELKSAKEQIVYGMSGVEVHSDAGRVYKRGKEIILTKTERDLLYYLSSNPGHVFRSGQILREVWSLENADHTEYLRVWVARLRRKLEDDEGKQSHKVIVTHPKEGYSFTKGFKVS